MRGVRAANLAGTLYAYFVHETYFTFAVPTI